MAVITPFEQNVIDFQRVVKFEGHALNVLWKIGRTITKSVKPISQ